MLFFDVYEFVYYWREWSENIEISEAENEHFGKAVTYSCDAKIIYRICEHCLNLPTNCNRHMSQPLSMLVCDASRGYIYITTITTIDYIRLS